MESDNIIIHKIESPNNGEVSFKLCAVDFDEGKTLKDEINSKLFNVIWIEKGDSEYQIDFNNYQISSESIFFLGLINLVEHLKSVLNCLHIDK